MARADGTCAKAAAEPKRRVYCRFFHHPPTHHRPLAFHKFAAETLDNVAVSINISSVALSSLFPFSSVAVMKSFAVVSVLASLALAQTTPTTTNPLIPSGISDSCNDFYKQLNANTTISQCLEPVISALAPLVSGSNSTCSAITSSLDKLCSAVTCSAQVIQSQLAQFSQSCNSELTGGQMPGVVLTYDALYLLGPFKKALCLKDNGGHYCLVNSTSSPAKRATLARREDAQAAFIPNITTFDQKNIAFLGLEPSLSADKLCVTCTKEIMNVYTTQMNDYPYSPGIMNSVLFPGQPKLYSAINSKCGPPFLGGEVQAAGGLATGAAPRSVDGGLAFVGSAFAAAAAGAVALL